MRINKSRKLSLPRTRRHTKADTPTSSTSQHSRHVSCQSILVGMLALLLACQLPLGALADDPASNENTASENTESESTTSESAASESAESENNESGDEHQNDQRSSPNIESLFPDFEILSLLSPDLLANSNTAPEQAAAGSAEDADETFDFSGTYTATLHVPDDYQELYSVTRGTLMPDKCAALVDEGATLLFVDGRLVKLGDASNTKQATAYGTNTALTVLGANSNALLVNSTLDTDAIGAPALAAINNSRALIQNTAINTHESQSNALVAGFGATILANALDVSTNGSESAALCTLTHNSNISAANSSFATSDESSPLISSAGRIELDNVTGTSEAAPLALLRDAGSLVVHGSRLVTNQNRTSKTTSSEGALMLYREDAVSRETLTDDTVFQASDSEIKSDLESGSLFYLTNTHAKIILSNTNLEFDDTNVPLLSAVSNNTHGWGTQGSNGASATMTAIDQTLHGDVIVDAESSVDLHLLEKSTWRGAATNVAKAESTLISDHLNVSIDHNSTWVVTRNSTVTNLNLATGARLIDPQGKGVKIHDNNGFSLVDGASDITVTVDGNFSSSIKTNSDNELENAQIDRSTFDNTFGLETAFGTNTSSVYTPEKLRIARLAHALQNWFKDLAAS